MKIDAESYVVLSCLYWLQMAKGKYTLARETANRILAVLSATNSDLETARSMVIENYLYHLEVATGNWTEVTHYLNEYCMQREPTNEWCQRMSKNYYRLANYETALFWVCFVLLFFCFSIFILLLFVCIFVKYLFIYLFYLFIYLFIMNYVKLFVYC
jgi:hypothetical protein